MNNPVIPTKVPLWKPPTQPSTLPMALPQSTVFVPTEAPPPHTPPHMAGWWRRFIQLVDNSTKLVQLLSHEPTYFPWNESPPDAQSYDETAVIVTPSVADGETEILTVPVPTGWDGCILGIAHNYLGPAGSINYAIPSLVWRIYLNTVPVKGYSQITTEFGNQFFPRPVSPILVNSGQTIRYTVTNNDPSIAVDGTFMYANFAGRFYPHKS